MINVFPQFKRRGVRAAKHFLLFGHLTKIGGKNQQKINLLKVD